MVNERAGDGGAELFAAGELPRQMGQAVAEADLFEEGFGAGAGGGDRFVPAAGEAGHEDVFQDGALGQQVVELENEPDGAVAETGGGGGRERAEGLAVDGDGARGGLVEGAEEIEQRGLAAAGRADDGDGFAGGDMEVEVAQDGDGAGGALVDFGNAGEVDHVRRGFSSGGLSFRRPAGRRRGLFRR